MSLNKLGSHPLITTTAPTLKVPNGADGQPASPGVKITPLPEGMVESESQRWNANARRFSTSVDGFSRLVEKLRHTSALELSDSVLLEAIRSEAKQFIATLTGRRLEVFQIRILGVNLQSLRTLAKQWDISHERVRQIEELLQIKLLNRVRLNLTRPKDLLRTSLEDTNLPRRAVNRLREHKIYTIGDLIGCPKELFNEMEGFGPVCLAAANALIYSVNSKQMP